MRRPCAAVLGSTAMSIAGRPCRVLFCRHDASPRERRVGDHASAVQRCSQLRACFLPDVCRACFPGRAPRWRRTPAVSRQGRPGCSADPGRPSSAPALGRMAHTQRRLPQFVPLRFSCLLGDRLRRGRRLCCSLPWEGLTRGCWGKNAESGRPRVWCRKRIGARRSEGRRKRQRTTRRRNKRGTAESTGLAPRNGRTIRRAASSALCQHGFVHSRCTATA